MRGGGRKAQILFSFTDSGIGLSKAEIAHLFRPFAQASAGTAQRFGGAGLGLVFVRRLARAMGGKPSRGRPAARPARAAPSGWR